jgi:spore coat protein A, manganese oxidase
MTSRRDVLRLGAVGSLSLPGLSLGANPAGITPRISGPSRPVPYAGVFRRPPVLLPYQTGEDALGRFERYAVTERLGRQRILPGVDTTVAGFNGIFPGPTIRVEQNVRTELRVRNRLPARGLLHGLPFKTVTHLHGSPSLPQYDGYANDFVPPNFAKTYRYPNTEAGRTLWYHDHAHHVTAQNVYSGLAAFYLLSDRYERAQLPQGEYDVPLLVSDALFGSAGSLVFDDDSEKGLNGDVILVNGVPWPTMKVKARVYRFRILVASISRSYRFTLSTGEPVYIIATDAGLVPTVPAVSSWRQGAAERYEVLIDFRRYRAGQFIELRNLSNKNNEDFASTGKVMRFEVVADSGAPTPYVIPTRLDDGGAPDAANGAIPVMQLTPAMARVKRQMRMERTNSEWVLNDTTWADVERSGFLKVFGNPQPYDVEQWTLFNSSGGWFHPMHLHLVDCRVIGRNTNGGKPFAWENGPKDTFYIGENESVTLLMQFVPGSPQGGGRYMIHCHNAVHEDHDMMIQYAVGDPRRNDPITSAPAVPDNTPLDAFPPVYAPGFPAGT